MIPTMEKEISQATQAGRLKDMRAMMPTHGQWPFRRKEQVLGVCCHQNAGGVNPKITAEYHTSPDNHITPGRPLPSICYHIAILPSDPVPWLVADPLWRTYSQGAPAPGDENTHLIAILVMGNFDGPGHKGKLATPLQGQMVALEHAVGLCQEWFGFSDAGLFGHYHFGKAACPGYTIQEWIEQRRKAAPDLKTELDWQKALLRWNPKCLPKYGADGRWGEECRRAVTAFQLTRRIQVTGLRDPFTELLLLRDHPGPA